VFVALVRPVVGSARTPHEQMPLATKIGHPPRRPGEPG
jgi:hypothetical protein